MFLRRMNICTHLCFGHFVNFLSMFASSICRNYISLFGTFVIISKLAMQSNCVLLYQKPWRSLRWPCQLWFVYLSLYCIRSCIDVINYVSNKYPILNPCWSILWLCAILIELLPWLHLKHKLIMAKVHLQKHSLINASWLEYAFEDDVTSSKLAQEHDWAKVLQKVTFSAHKISIKSQLKLHKL